MLDSFLVVYWGHLMESASGGGDGTNHDDPGKMVGDLPGLADVAEELGQLLSRPVAPVRMPPPDELEVRLVSEQTLERLFEAEKDASLHSNLLLLAIGTLLGFFTNVVTSEQFEWSRPVVTYVGLLGAVVVAFALLTLRATRRVRQFREKIGGTRRGR